jgi:dihydrofolate synthase / folylpolyglutamate synthase
MNYKETIDYLYANLPMFQNIGIGALKLNLDNSLRLDKIFGSPHQKFKMVHVAGTNGKGSVSHMTASILQQAGYKTGLFTSPHLKDFRERIRVNGKMIPEEYVIQFMEIYIDLNRTQNIKASFFELTTTMAFRYFADSKVDIAIIETGLGGRLDSTNIISPILSVITNISFDHMAILGNTLEKIALEKAGIIKPETPVVIGENQPETRNVFTEKAASLNAPLYFADSNFKAIQLKGKKFRVHNLISGESNLFESELQGNYQEKNIPTVLKTIEQLILLGFNISPFDIQNGIKHAISITGLLGRWQILSEKPKIICDTAHNTAGITFAMNQLRCEVFENLHIVFGVVNDKDIDSVLKLLPVNARYYFTKARLERALDENILSEKAKSVGLKGDTYPTVPLAIEAAKQQARMNDLIYIGGSTFVVAEAI